MAKYETAEYKVLEKDGKFEIRSYESYYTAATAESNIKEVSGFNKIFDYISGNNSNKEKISMTSPVINELKPGGVTTEFVMPSKYTKDPPSEPDNPEIKIKKIEKKTCASVTFSGFVNDSKIQAYQMKLKKWLQAKNIRMLSSFRLARYNPPYVPPPFRRNEILIDVENS